MTLALICAGMLAMVPADKTTSSPPADPQTYQEARDRAGRSPDDQVRLALWCEAHGLTAERLHHLALAVLADPTHATARGLMGMVAYGGRFQRPEAVADKVRADASMADALAGYGDRRQKAAYTAEAQWQLGLWCESHGLPDQARAHFIAVTRLDPAREGAWRRLGYRKLDGRWVTDSRLAAERAEAEAQKQADKRWKPLLEKYRAALGDKNPARRAEAEAALVEVTDPRAVRSVWAVFAAGNGAPQALAVRLLGQIEGETASQALAYLAIRGTTPEARRAATETLVHRDPREFVGLLVALIRKPVRYEVRPLNGPQSPGVLFVEGEKYNIRRLYVQPPIPAAANLPRLFTDDVPFNPGFWPVVPATNRPGNAIDLGAVAERRDAQIANGILLAQNQAQAVQRQLNEDIEAVESTNAAIRATNERVLPVLKDVTGKDFGEDPEAWQRWQTDQAGYAFRESSSEKPTFDQVVRIEGISSGHSCFGAGTTVRTIDGSRAIEDLRAGDRVMVQDPRTGSLGFQPIVTVFHNPPSPTLRVKLGGETVVTTGIHRFWKAGKGWTMARDLRPGDPIRTLEGVAKVDAVEDDKAQPVFNIEVAQGHDFLVGNFGILVHDNSLVEPVTAPFDAPTGTVTKAVK